MTRATAIHGLILAILFGVICYVGPSEHGTINATAETGAQYAR